MNPGSPQWAAQTRKDGVPMELKEDRYLKGIHEPVLYQDEFGRICTIEGKDHEHFFVNIFKWTWLVCEGCKARQSIGSRIFGDWEEENEEIWQKRWDHIKDYEDSFTSTEWLKEFYGGPVRLEVVK